MKGIACLGLLAALCSVRGAAAQEPARHAVGLELRGDTMIYRSVALPCRHGAGNHVWSGYAYEPWTPAQKVFALSKFWSEARRNYVRMDRVGTERWDSLYLSLIEPARQTRNDDEFYRLMQYFCAFLEDEHTFVTVDRNYPQSAESFGDGWVLSFVTIDGRVIVNEVARAKGCRGASRFGGGLRGRTSGCRMPCRGDVPRIGIERACTSLQGGRRVAARSGRHGA